MRVTEKLLKENNKPKTYKDFEPDIVEMHMEKEKNKEPINKRKSVFQSEFENGINSNKSVFDRQATFRTNN